MARRKGGFFPDDPSPAQVTLAVLCAMSRVAWQGVGHPIAGVPHEPCYFCVAEYDRLVLFCEERFPLVRSVEEANR